MDALGKPVGLAPDDNLTLYGNAVAAAVGLGLWPDLASAAGRCVRISPPCCPILTGTSNTGGC